MGLIKDIICALTNKDNIERDIDALKRKCKTLEKEIDSMKKGESPFQDEVLVKSIKKQDKKEEYVKSNKVEPLRVDCEKSAKEVFKENIELFIPFLSDLTEKTYDCAKWDKLIESVGSSDLSGIWSKTKGKSEAMTRILAFWGYRPELCMSFVCSGKENDMYEVEGVESLENGAKYDVISKCWLYTDDKGIKSVVVKGKVKKQTIQ